MRALHKGVAAGGRQPWDFFRFVKTVAYFNELPSPDKLLQGLVKQLSPQGAGDSVVPVELPQASSSGAVEVPITGIVMVTGATGGVGRRVVARLLAAGKHVRALVRDLEKARGMLSDLPVAPGGKLELAAADVTQRQTLLPEMFEGVRAVVCCTAVKVVPKEGDTVDRSKYYQGIKFYDPEIQGDTPEAVEYVGMENLLDAVADSLGTIRLPFADFFPVFRAKRLSGPTATPLDPSAISSIQIMLSKFEYDGDLNPAFRRGPFRLPFTSIAAYLPAGVPPRFVHVSSAGVTRPNRPGIDVNQEPPAVKLNDTLGGILTWKLAGEDSLRDSGVPFAVVRPTALTEEPGGMPLELDQGDTVKGKISRDDVADLCVALLGCPAATNTTFEVKSTVPFSQPWTGPEPSAPRRDWFATLNQARLRPGVTGRTVLGVYTGRKTEVEALAAAGVSTSDAASKPTATAAA
eukprot:XP_001700919.1 protein with predicted nucleoside-diphosphate-sugar epimerase activity [Chlamydomonas reinhardtii]